MGNNMENDAVTSRRRFPEREIRKPVRVLVMDDRKTAQEISLGEMQMKRLRSLSNVKLIYGYEYVAGAVASAEQEVLAFHRDFLMENGWLDDVVREAMEASRYLVLFSGSVSENMLFENCRVLRMNAEDFYSERTVTFFASLQNVSRAPQEAVPNAGETDHLLLKLLYGDDWAVPFAFRWRHLRWMASGSSSGPAADNVAADEAAARIIAEYVERI